VISVARAVLLKRACLRERGSDITFDFHSAPGIRVCAANHQMR